MLNPIQIEELIELVGNFDRPTLIKHFDNYKGRFPIDFTPEFFQSTPIERLRHIYLAVCLQNERMPDVYDCEAA